jgi:hypothetical protein
MANVSSKKIKTSQGQSIAFSDCYRLVPIMLREVVASKHRVDGKTFIAIFAGYLFAVLPTDAVGTVSIPPPSLILLTATVSCTDRFWERVLFQRDFNVVW